MIIFNLNKPVTYLILIFSLSILFTSCADQDSSTAASTQLKTFDIPDNLNFSEHIVHIIHQNCTSCHRPGEAGPFNLITYDDVRRRASMVAHVTAERIMPPWPANPEYRRFANERLLTDKEIYMINQWVEKGAPPGDEALLPPPPEFPEYSMHGEPDLVLEFEPVHVEGINEDVFLLMKVPYELPRDTFIRLIEFVPGNREAVHHMNANLVQFEDHKKSDVFDGLNYIRVDETGSMEKAHQKLGILNDDGSYPLLTPMVSNYLPGVEYYPYPEGIGGYRMKRKGAFYINDMHYGPTPIPFSDTSRFNIFFSETPPQRPTHEIILGTLGISEIKPPLVIPPDTVMKFTTEATVAQDVSLLTINPHMHLLGKSFKAYAITPESDTIPLIHIPRWNFMWQYFYTFRNPVKIPANSRVIAEGVYDNTSDNLLNPFDPPQTVAERDGSMKTTDEMFQFIVTYVPYKEGDENISLEQSIDNPKTYSINH